MTLHHLRAPAIALLVALLSAATLAFAEEETPVDPQYEKDRTECLRTLNFPERLLTRSSFAIRLESCIEVREAERDRLARTERLRNRNITIMNRITRNSNSYLWHRYLIENGQADEIDRQPDAPEPEPIVRTAPTRRSILRSTQSNTTEEGRTSSGLLYRSRIEEARSLCADQTTSFLRTNCMREELRKLGSQ